MLPAYRVNHGRDVVWLLVGNVLDGLHRAWYGTAARAQLLSAKAQPALAGQPGAIAWAQT
jgi:hypothetical protein